MLAYDEATNLRYGPAAAYATILFIYVAVVASPSSGCSAPTSSVRCGSRGPPSAYGRNASRDRSPRGDDMTAGSDRSAGRRKVPPAPGSPYVGMRPWS